MLKRGRVKALEVILEGDAYEKGAFLKRVMLELARVQGVKKVRILTRVIRAKID